VADFFNQAIRKISIQNKVTTIPVPYSGNTGIFPEEVCLAVDGTFYIANTAYGITVFNNKKGINFYSRIRNADSNLDMEGDSKGVFWFVNDNSLGRISGINIQRNVVNFSAYLAPNETLRGLGIGPNGVKYVSTATQLFKVTSTGEITKLYKDYKFIFISGITVTKDGSTIYIADGNAVKKIYQDQITTIANPLPVSDGRDGIGLNADVRSANVALANSEKALFVSDTRNIIRKITLP
jgi:streptogramin lyase